MSVKMYKFKGRYNPENINFYNQLRENRISNMALRRLLRARNIRVCDRLLTSGSRGVSCAVERAQSPEVLWQTHARNDGGPSRLGCSHEDWAWLSDDGDRVGVHDGRGYLSFLETSYHFSTQYSDDSVYRNFVPSRLLWFGLRCMNSTAS
jgi:hypothetical protein